MCQNCCCLHQHIGARIGSPEKTRRSNQSQYHQMTSRRAFASRQELMVVKAHRFQDVLSVEESALLCTWKLESADWFHVTSALMA